MFKNFSRSGSTHHPMDCQRRTLQSRSKRSAKSSELRSKSTPGLASTLSATPFVVLRLFCLHLGFRLLPRQSFGLSFGLSGGMAFFRLRNEGPQKKSEVYLALEVATVKALANLATLKTEKETWPGLPKTEMQQPLGVPSCRNPTGKTERSDFSNSAIC